MFFRLWTVLLIAVWIFNIIHPMCGGNVVLLISCTTQVVNLNYTTPLPAATGGLITTSVRDSGTWSPCQLGRLNATVKYYVSVNLTQANCERANFTELVSYGFFNITLLPLGTSYLLNFTVVLSNPKHTRQLDVPQIFNGTLSTPSSVQLPPPANITFTFNSTYHQSSTCSRVSSEQVKVDPYVYLLNTDGLLDFLNY